MIKNKEMKVKQLSENFIEYVNSCEDYRSYDASAYLYLLLLNKYIIGKELGNAFNESDFFELLYATLCSWDMNTRGAKLREFKDFKISIIENKEHIIKLQKYRIEELKESQLNNEVFPQLENIFKNLKIANNKTQIVSLSKTLHFMLPYLIMPIDRRYTMSYLYGYDNYSDDWKSEFKTFKEIFSFFHEVTKNANIANLNNKSLIRKRLNTSVTKILDNAIIGYVREQNKIKE